MYDNCIGLGERKFIGDRLIENVLCDADRSSLSVTDMLFRKGESPLPIGTGLLYIFSPVNTTGGIYASSVNPEGMNDSSPLIQPTHIFPD